MRRLLWILFLLPLALACNRGNPLLPSARGDNSSTAVLGEKTEQNETPEPPRYTEISLKAQSRRVPVIMYHDVIPERVRESQWFDCSVDEFEKQMNFLALEGAQPISLQELYDHLTTGKEIPEKAVVLTFDDNYQGFYDNAYPILKRYGYPAAMFVHTGYVGNKEGQHPKMTWDTLRELVKDPLITIGAHTVMHPEDITLLSEEEQRKEVTDCKGVLEKELGIKCDFFAYPAGKNNSITQRLAWEAGYKMAFTIENGLAEESPSIIAINRYIHTRLETAWSDREDAMRGGAMGIVRDTIEVAPLELEVDTISGVKLALITGGMAETVTSDTREGVWEFVERTGAQAGINGTFFAMAAIKSTDNKLVGPCLTPEMTEVIGDADATRWEKLRNRPVVMWSDKEFAIVPFQPETMRTDAAFRDFMPDVKNVMMGGAWLVHEYRALTKSEMDLFGSKDIQDPRRRAFVGLDENGRFVIGASRQSVSSERLASALTFAGVRHAVLLDSGFSTSLVYGDSILASGHSTASRPSRPVPHAIVLKGKYGTPETDAYKYELARGKKTAE